MGDVERPEDRATVIRRQYERAVNEELPLESLRQLEELVEHLGHWRRRLVYVARGKGATFADVARVYGITRQAARERFKDIGPAEASRD